MIAAPITVVPTRDDDVIDNNTDADALVHRRDDDDLSDDDDVPALVPVPDVIVRPDVLTVRPVMSRGVLNRANIFAHASAFSIAYSISIKDPYAISWFFPATRSLVDLGCVRPAGVHGCAQQATARAAALSLPAGRSTAARSASARAWRSWRRAVSSVVTAATSASRRAALTEATATDHRGSEAAASVVPSVASHTYMSRLWLSSLRMS